MTAQTARITPGNARLTPGKRLRRTLNKALAAGCEWTEVELITLDLIEAAADRAAALEAHLAVELAKPVLSRRSVEIASEVRQLEVNIAKMVAQLVPDPAAVVPKSAQHQRAAHSRWHHG